MLTTRDTNIDNYIWILDCYGYIHSTTLRLNSKCTKSLIKAPSGKEALALSEPAGWQRLTKATAAEHAG